MAIGSRVNPSRPVWTGISAKRRLARSILRNWPRRSQPKPSVLPVRWQAKFPLTFPSIQGLAALAHPSGSPAGRKSRFAVAATPPTSPSVTAPTRLLGLPTKSTPAICLRRHRLRRNRNAEGEVQREPAKEDSHENPHRDDWAGFGLLTLAHIARMFEEGAHLITQPVFLLTTVGSASVCVWAIILLKKLRHSRASLSG